MSSATDARSLKDKQRQEREEMILQAAEGLLAEKGYHDTSIDEIGARVGISKATVYLHFKTKEELVFALFERDLRRFPLLMENILASAKGPRAQLEELFRTMYTAILSKKFQVLSAMSTTPALRKIFEEHHEHLKALSERPVAEVRMLLEAGKVTGDFDPLLPTEVMVSTFFSLLSPQVHQRLFVNTSQLAPDELVSALERIYFRGIAAH
jgi:TetR/AcrR family fatty acid metabolism transcriptional regulator